MNKRCREIMDRSKERGWVLEPEAKEIMALEGLETAPHMWIRTAGEIDTLDKKLTFPVIAKVVSPMILHKTERGGVIKNIATADDLARAFRDLSSLEGFSGIVVDEMINGIEVIMGAQKDPQFGDIVLIGIGGTSVEIYRDTAVRLAPVSEDEALRAIESLRGRDLLTGFRGAAPVELKALAKTFSRFSEAACRLGETALSIDLNPVICSGSRAIIADARIVL